MLRRLPTRRILAFVLSLGVFLMGAVPSWAISMGGKDNMPSMTMMMFQGNDMNCDCSDMAGKSMPKDAPCKNCALCYAVCTAAAANSGMIPALALTAISRNGEPRLFGAGAQLDGLTHPPALPPPILRA